MIRRINYALALILLVLAVAACGKKEEAQSQKTEPAAAQPPAIIPGEMVLIPAGEYIIGKDEKDPENKSRWTNTYPEHKVKLPAFWIDRYEATGMEFLEFTSKTAYVAEGESENKTWRTFFNINKPHSPVTYVTWKDADSYCKGMGKRLPTEEEWEAAARGPNGLRFPWGNDWQDNRANTMEAGSGVPDDVGKFDDVSPFGVHDMFGNVQEWTASMYKPYKGNPGGDEYNKGQRVVRGLSSSFKNGRGSGLYVRMFSPPNYLANFGCRCAKDATPADAAKAAPAK